MIISRTPLRMSFVGGGSDMPQFYRAHGGAVISTAIDKYIFITANKKFDTGIRLSYSKTEEVAHVDQIEHPLARHAMQFLELSGGIEITTVADIPSRGTGLGSSSAFAVGLLNALYAFSGRFASGMRLGAEACHIEIERLGEPIGKQDQYAAANGGFCVYEFNADESVTAMPVVMPPGSKAVLESHLIMFYTGITRSASAILKDQATAISSDANKIRGMRRMVELVYVMRNELQSGALASFGPILHENWVLKKQMTRGVSNAVIDEAYDAAIAAGATGGKILGAGSGGFFVFFAAPEHHAAIVEALAPLKRVPFRFENSGSRIIFAD